MSETLYFESFYINDRRLDKPRYFLTTLDSHQNVNRTDLWLSTRVWAEANGKVWYLKNRHDPGMPVDLEEFFWIKLKAKAL